MQLAKIVGGTFVAHLSDAARFPLLVIGKDRWSYRDVARLGIIHPRACRILSKVAAELGVADVKALYAQTSPYYLAGLQGVGVTTVYALLQVFRAKGLSVDRWYAPKDATTITTFTTLKHREQQAEQRTLAAERKRRRRGSVRQVRDDARASAAVH